MTRVIMGQFLIGWGSWRQHAARIAPRDNSQVLPHLRIIKDLSADHKSFLTMYNSNNPETRTDSPDRYRPAKCGNPNPSPWFTMAGVQESKSVESCPSGQR